MCPPDKSAVTHNCTDTLSGGIGPTYVSPPSFSIPSKHKTLIHASHDDITYKSIAKAFGLPLVLHQEAYTLMKKLSKPHPEQPNFNWDEDSAALRARLRMVELPTDASRPLEEQFLFPCKELWVPVAVVNGNVHILPGVPRLCKSFSRVPHVY